MTDQPLTVARVRERYSLSTPEAARRVMLQTGHAFKLGGRLYVHLEALIALEQARRELPNGRVATGDHSRRRATPAALGALTENWWQDR